MAKNTKYLSVTLKLDGLKEFQRLLRDAPPKVAKKATRAATNAGVAIVSKATKSRVKRRSGTTKKAVKKKVKGFSDGNHVGIVGVDRKATGDYRGRRVVPGNIWHLIQNGTKAHAVKSRMSKLPEEKRRKRKTPRKDTYQHPGATASHALRDAVAATTSQVGKAMEAKVREVVLREMKK